MLLAMSMLLTLLAGCGKDKGGAPDPTPEATKQTFDPAAYVRDRSMSLPTPPLTKKKRCI